MMTMKYGLHFFFELTVNDGQNFLADIVRVLCWPAMVPFLPWNDQSI
jgi:hypothetical protein